MTDVMLMANGMVAVGCGIGVGGRGVLVGGGIGVLVGRGVFVAVGRGVFDGGNGVTVRVGVRDGVWVAGGRAVSLGVREGVKVRVGV